MNLSFLTSTNPALHKNKVSLSSLEVGLLLWVMLLGNFYNIWTSAHLWGQWKSLALFTSFEQQRFVLNKPIPFWCGIPKKTCNSKNSKNLRFKKNLRNSKRAGEKRFIKGYRNPQGYWRWLAAIKRLAVAAKVVEEQAKKSLVLATPLVDLLAHP